ncbi:hypothetical protein B0H11DRAFT_2076207, partial [Mycena galericulata]
STTSTDRRVLSRDDRSLCRALSARGIPAEYISQYLGRSESTIKRATRNNYDQPDNLENDVLPADFDDILRAVRAKRKEKGNASTAKKPDRPVRHLAQVITTHTQGTDAATFTAKTTDVRRLLPFRRQRSDASRTFLDVFVDGIPLDRAWADVMRRAGWSEEKLRKIAGAPEKGLKEFVENSSLLKDMLEIDKFTLVLAIKRLAIAL